MSCPRKIRFAHHAARRGFTLFEILVSLAIGLILVGGAAAYSFAFSKDRHLYAASDTAVSYLRTAAMRAIQSEGNSSHGVSLSGGQFTLFRGSSYASRDTDHDIIWASPAYVTASGPQEIVFGKQTAVPSVTGDIILSNGRKTVTITVYPTGAISQP
jgi:prepilin-type N-terminal cleavage/methylation domain-containing protein